MTQGVALCHKRVAYVKKKEKITIPKHGDFNYTPPD